MCLPAMPFQSLASVSGAVLLEHLNRSETVQVKVQHFTSKEALQAYSRACAGSSQSHGLLRPMELTPRTWFERALSVLMAGPMGSCAL